MISVKKYIIMLIFFTVTLGVFGIANHNSFTDITSEENYLTKFAVGEMPGNIAKEECLNLLQQLPDCKYIFRARVVSDLEVEFNACRQKISIQEVFQGNVCYKEYYITTRRWNFVIDGDDKTIERGYINILDEGDDYLFFCDEIINTDNEIQTFKLYEDSYIAPVFCYNDKDNTIVPTSGETTYVPFEQVKGNEFFASDALALEEWNNLKSSMIMRYYNTKETN